MKALIYCDWCVIKSTSKTYALVCAVMAVAMCAGFADEGLSAAELASSTQMTIVSMSATMLTLMSFFQLFGNDERVGWEAQRLSLPNTRRTVVLARYAFVTLYLLAMTLVGIVVGTLVGAAVSLALTGTPAWAIYPQTPQLMAGVLLAALAYMAIAMPLLFWKGVSKGRFGMAALFMVVPLAITSAGRDKIEPMLVWAQHNELLLAALVVLLVAASLALSLRLYATRDF